MFVKHESATSVATSEGEITSKGGVFEVPEELGLRLLRLFGFEQHAAPVEEPEPVKRGPGRPKKDTPEK